LSFWFAIQHNFEALSYVYTRISVSFVYFQFVIVKEVRYCF